MAQPISQFARLAVLGYLLAFALPCGVAFSQQEPPEPDDQLRVADPCQISAAARKVLEQPLTAITAETAVTLDPANGRDQLPVNCAGGLFHGAGDHVSGAASAAAGLVEFHWAATELWHQPLYFDDVPLERYGQTISPKLQPVLSGTRFFLTFPIVPYKIGIDRTHDCISTLGYYRPGSPAPCVRQRVPPPELDAAMFEAGAWVGLVFLLP